MQRLLQQSTCIFCVAARLQILMCIVKTTQTCTSFAEAANQQPACSCLHQQGSAKLDPAQKHLLTIHCARFYRAALLQQVGAIEVRLAEPDDVVGLHGLIGGLPNAVEVQETFLHALGKLAAF